MGSERTTAAKGLSASIGLDRGDFSLDIELEIEPGTTLALLGPNGAGKSTAVAALAGLLAIDRGRIELNGRTLDRASDPVFVPAEQRRVGVVFQNYALFPHLSVIDNVAFGLRNGGHVVTRRPTRREATSRSRALLEILGVGSIASLRPKDISGGQAQRVALARALAIEPELLLLDEPLSALDVSTRVDLRHTLKSRLQAFAGPRLLITHDPTDAFVLADRICIIESGRVVQSGTPDDIRAHPATSYVADLAGLNLLEGTSAGSDIMVDGGTAHLRSASQVTGRVLVTIRPNAVSIHRESPEGSPRNSWPTVVAGLEPLGETIRVQLGAPLPIMVDITPAAAFDLGLEVGSKVWAAVKATEIGVTSNERSVRTE